MHGFPISYIYLELYFGIYFFLYLRFITIYAFRIIHTLQPQWGPDFHKVNGSHQFCAMWFTKFCLGTRGAFVLGRRVVDQRDDESNRHLRDDF